MHAMDHKKYRRKRGVAHKLPGWLTRGYANQSEDRHADERTHADEPGHRLAEGFCGLIADALSLPLLHNLERYLHR